MNADYLKHNDSYYAVITLEDGRRFVSIPDEWNDDDFFIGSHRRNGLLPVRRRDFVAVLSMAEWKKSGGIMIGSHGGQHWQSFSTTEQRASVGADFVQALARAVF